jgi:Uma2 family endonuclease
MPSPVSGDHGEPSSDVIGWLVHYKRFTPGVRSASDATVKLDDLGETQPDCQLRIPAELGGQTHLDEKRYISGAPELVVEIARSSRSYDLTQKKADYERAGVVEYLVVEIEPNRIHWFIRRGRRFVQMRPGPDGVYRSKAFPGLWLDAEGLFADDLDRVIGVLEQGLATPEHAAFVAKLTRARSGKKP